MEVQLRLIDLPVFRVCYGTKGYQIKMQIVVCFLCSQHIDAQKELLEELYEDKLNNLKESLTDYYQEEIQERDEKIEELQAALQEAKQKLDAKQRDSEQGLRRSKRVAASCALQQELTDTKAKLEQCQMELNTTSSELRKYQRLLEPPPSAKPITVDVDKKLEDGQKVTLSLLEKETLAHQSACQ